MTTDNHSITPLQGRRGFLLRLTLGVLLLDLVVIGLVVFVLHQGRQQHEERARVVTQNLSHVLEHNLAEIIDKFDIVLLAIVDEAERQDRLAGVDRSTLNAFMERQHMRLPECDNLRMADAEGTIRYGTGLPGNVVINVADRDYFSIFRNRPETPLFISKPFKGRLNGKWLVSVSRRVKRSDGTLLGVVWGTIPIDYLTQIFAALDIGPHGGISLRDHEMGIIARFPAPREMDSIAGNKAVSSELRQAMEKSQVSGTFFTPESWDKLPKIVSYQRITHYPLYVIVGLAQEDFLSGWHGDVLKLSLLAVAYIGITLILARGIYVRWKREQSAESRLRTLNEELESHIRARTDELIQSTALLQAELAARLKAQEEIKLARDFYLTIFEGLPVMIWRAGTDGGCDYFNGAWLEFTGRTLKQEMGDGWIEGVHPDDLADFLQVYRGAFKTRQPFEMEYRLRNAGGEYRWIIDYGRPYNNLQGAFAGYIGSCYDISDSRQNRAALEESEQRFRQLFEQSEDAIMIFDREHGTIVDFNSVTETMFGYSREELSAARIPLFIDADKRARFIEIISALDKKGLEIPQIELIRRDGTAIIGSIRGKLITLMQRQVVYCSFRDITGRILHEERLRADQAKLIQADKMASLGLLVSGIAHEINNPNNFMLFNATLLRDAWMSVMPILEEYYQDNGDFNIGDFQFSDTRDIVPRLFSGLVEGSTRIRTIVEKLKSFARQDSGNVDEQVDVNKVILDAIAIVNHEIKKTCNNFVMSPGRDLPLVQGNAQQIEQVMINLIMNALQALPDKKRGVRIETALAEDGNHVAITVTDEGEGMSAEVLERVSEPFFTTKSEQGGTGLGLSISTSILRRNSGTLSFSSEPGKGTAATVKLPVFVQAGSEREMQP